MPNENLNDDDAWWAKCSLLEKLEHLGCVDDTKWGSMLREQVNELLAAATRRDTKNMSDGCKLVAAHTGDGWILEVHNAADETIGFLAWPESWPASVTTKQLESFGFEVV